MGAASSVSFSFADVSSPAFSLRAPKRTPLAEAASCGDAEAVKALLDAGADKDEASELGWTPLHEAAYRNHVEVVRLLLVHGADATRHTAQGALPFNVANCEEVREAIRELGGPDAVKEMAVPTLLFGTDENGRLVLAISQPEEPCQASEEAKRSAAAAAAAAAAQRQRAAAAAAAAGEPKLLHKGAVLGELPALGRATRENGAVARTRLESGEEDVEPPEVAPAKGESAAASSSRRGGGPHRRRHRSRAAAGSSSEEAQTSASVTDGDAAAGAPAAAAAEAAAGVADAAGAHAAGAARQGASADADANPEEDIYDFS